MKSVDKYVKYKWMIIDKKEKDEVSRQVSEV